MFLVSQKRSPNVASFMCFIPLTAGLEYSFSWSRSIKWIRDNYQTFLKFFRNSYKVEGKCNIVLQEEIRTDVADICIHFNLLFICFNMCRLTAVP